MADNSAMSQKIRKLHGPVLVLGASGFIGANLLRMLLAERSDVYGTASHLPAWRLEDIPRQNVIEADLIVKSNIKDLFDRVRPLTVFNCIAYGAYSFERDHELIYDTNLIMTSNMLEELSSRDIRCYVHAGSSSEYGKNCAGPAHNSAPAPNSHYAVSKAGAAGLLYYMGTERKFPCANLRLYSVYGPYEDSSRLIPAIVEKGTKGELPAFVSPETSRDFVYVDDACEAFIDTALNLTPERYGQSFNIGSGKPTTMRDAAEIARKVFSVGKEPEFNMPGRDWDTTNWYADPAVTEQALGWRARVGFEDGLRLTTKWFEALPDREAYMKSSKKFGMNQKYSVSAIIACYKDAQAIPIMYERLTKVFHKLGVDYEIIFVNDCSPDDSEAVIQKLSSRDPHVIGISHSRNFGSQSAFRSGMEIARKNSCVLLDGDLQDPPEIIEQFVQKWKEGFDIVYGRRVKREAPLHMQFAYKAFYRIFDYFSYIKIPHDAGDFSLMSKRVVRTILQFPERDIFMRGIRAFAGYKQTGVDYVRPERMFGRSTNSLLKNLGWAKKGILSFSVTPLNIMSFAGVSLFVLSLLLIVLQIFLKLFMPDVAPKGFTTLILLITLFGSLNLLAASTIGEYISKIFEEVKRRPHFIRRSIIKDGLVRDASQGIREDGELER